MSTFVDAYIQYANRSILPADGGWLDQSESFVAAVAIADAERGRMEDAKGKDRESDRSRQQSKARTEAYRNKGKGGRRG